MAICFALVMASCKDEETPTDPIQGNWSLFSGYVESQTEILATNVTTDPSPCFYDGQAASPGGTSTNALTINANQTGSFGWNIRCTPPENYSFTWQLTGDNEITIDHVSGESWVWNITALSDEFMDVEFYREREIELQFSGTAIAMENIQLKFRRVE